jgi:hypothetical protein
MNIPFDKQLHLAAGAGIAIVAGFVTGMPVVGLALGFAAGLGKEAYDRWANQQAAKHGEPPPHGVEFMDFVATAAGACVGSAFVYIVLTYGTPAAT